MEKIRLGRTGLMVSRTSFGALPIQRTDYDEAKRILRRAFDAGINYYDTANMYTNSEEKLGMAFEGMRQDIIISTKSGGTDKATVAAHIDNSLKMLRTDYIDLFQFHNMPEVFDPNDPDGPWTAALEAKKAGKILHIGLTSHRADVAETCIETGLYETLQFPFSYISADRDLALAKRCKELDVGFIAMKGLAGGMLTNAKACYCFMRQYDNVVPIWGIQHMWELEQFIELDKADPAMDDELKAVIEKDRTELAGNFCRGCGYCMPCPVDIPINMAARMDRLLRRSPNANMMTEEFYKVMHRIDDCIGCGSCKAHCPYELDTPELLKYMLKDYDRFYKDYHSK